MTVQVSPESKHKTAVGINDTTMHHKETMLEKKFNLYSKFYAHTPTSLSSVHW